MELDHREVNELASFFARRFPLPEQRKVLAKAARMTITENPGIDARTAWIDLLGRASGRTALLRIARAAARAQPDDANLQEVVGLMVGKRDVPAPPAVGLRVAVAALLLTAVGLGAWALTGTLPVQANATATAPAAATEPTEPAPDEMPVAAAAPAAPALVTVAPPAEEPEFRPARPWVETAALLDQAEPAPVKKQSTRTKATRLARNADTSPAWFSGPCTTEKGGIVGYWYAGEASPGSAGEVITLQRPVFVRADFPDDTNGFDAQAPIRCSLGEGDKVRLSEDPILVPGDRYWVPLVSGDLQR